MHYNRHLAFSPAYKVEAAPMLLPICMNSFAMCVRTYPTSILH